MPKAAYLQQSVRNGRSNCCACALRHEMVFSEVALDDVSGFHHHVDDYVFPAGVLLQGAGRPAEAVYCIKRGAVKLVKYDPNGGQRIVRLLKKGDVADLQWTVSAVAQHAAVAVGEVHACRIPMPFFTDFARRHPKLQLRLLQKSQEALREAELWLAQLLGGALSVRVKTARLLLRLRQDDGDRLYRLSNEEMGAILGVAHESVSRVVAEFLRLGILARAGADAGSRHLRGDIAALEDIAMNS